MYGVYAHAYGVLMRMDSLRPAHGPPPSNADVCTRAVRGTVAKQETDERSNLFRLPATFHGDVLDVVGQHCVRRAPNQIKPVTQSKQHTHAHTHTHTRTRTHAHTHTHTHQHPPTNATSPGARVQVSA